MSQNWSFAARIGAGFFAMVAILLIITINGVQALNHTNSNVTILADRYLAFSQNIQASQLAIINLRRYEKDAFIHLNDINKRQDYFARWEKSLQNARQHLATAHQLANDNDDLRASKLPGLQELESQLKQYEQGFHQVYQQIDRGLISNSIDADNAIEPHKIAVSNSEKTIASLVKSINNEADKLQTELGGDTKDASTILLGLAIGGTLLAIIVATLVVLSIRRPLTHIGALTEQLAQERDLTLQFPDFGRNEIGNVGRSLNSLVNTVRELIRESHDHSVRLVSAAAELSHVNDKLSTATEQQSQAASENAAAIEQLTVSISHMADNANGVEDSALTLFYWIGVYFVTASTQTHPDATMRLLYLLYPLAMLGARHYPHPKAKLPLTLLASFTLVGFGLLSPLDMEVIEESFILAPLLLIVLHPGKGWPILFALLLLGPYALGNHDGQEALIEDGIELIAITTFATVMAYYHRQLYKQMLFYREGGCKNFCVNGQSAGNCHLARRHHEHQETHHS